LCEQAPDLYYRIESAFGGEALLGTEGLRLTVLNVGYSLCRVVLRLRGVNKKRAVCLDVQRTIESLPRGALVNLDVASYEITAPLHVLRVFLETAEYAHEGEDRQGGQR